MQTEVVDVGKSNFPRYVVSGQVKGNLDAMAQIMRHEEAC